MNKGKQLNTQNRKTEGDALHPKGLPTGPLWVCGCRLCPPLSCKPPGLPLCPQHLAWRLSPHNMQCCPRRMIRSPAPSTPGPLITSRTHSHEALQTVPGEFRKGDSGTLGPPASSHPGIGPGRHRASGDIQELTGPGRGGRSTGRGPGRQAPPGRGENLREAGLSWPLWAPFPALRGAGGRKGVLLLPRSPPHISANFVTLMRVSRTLRGFPVQGKLVAA